MVPPEYDDRQVIFLLPGTVDGLKKKLRSSYISFRFYAPFQRFIIMKQLLTLLFCCPFLVCAQTGADINRLDSLLRVVHQEQPFNGNVLIAKAGEVIYRGSFGYANLDTRQPLDSATTFRLASVSKQFTALGIALLEHQEKLSFDDPLAKHIPELSFYPGVTLRHLIHHEGGLPDYMELAARKGDRKLVYDNEMIIALMAAQQPKAEQPPGTGFSYSNTGYLLLASVIERVSGQSYADFLQEEVFTPLGMTRTAVNFPVTRTDANVAAGFGAAPKTGKMIRLDNGDDPFGFYILAKVVGDGAIFATTDDLLRYHQGMQTDKLLPADKRRVLVTAGPSAKGPNNGYAFGQLVDKEGTRLSHSGSWAGAITYLERYPESDDLMAILSNTSAEFSTIRMYARQLLAGEPLTPLKVFTPVEVTATQIKPFAGNYQLDEKMTLAITTKKKQLRMLPTGQRNFLMTPYADNAFFLEGTTIDIRFNTDENGEVSSLTFTQDGKTKVCPRLP